MRSSRQDTEKHRNEIIDASSRLFREKGIAGVSIPELMQSVGMTHGGFYKHFPSKDELVPAAYDKAFEQTLARLDSAAAEHGSDKVAAWDSLVSGYLSEAHRDNPATGCAVTALASDTSRADGNALAQAAFDKGVEAMLAHIGRLQGGRDVRARSVAALATMVGALLIARGTSGALSDEFLDTARKTLLK